MKINDSRWQSISCLEVCHLLVLTSLTMSDYIQQARLLTTTATYSLEREKRKEPAFEHR